MRARALGDPNVLQRGALADRLGQGGERRAPRELDRRQGLEVAEAVEERDERRVGDVEALEGRHAPEARREGREARRGSSRCASFVRAQSSSGSSASSRLPM